MRTILSLTWSGQVYTRFVTTNGEFAPKMGSFRIGR
jgi:hypothetical protein